MSEETKLSTPALRVDTQSTPPTHGLSSSLSNPLQTPTSATSPTFHIPLTPSELQVSPSAHLAKLVSFQNASHAKDESRKLLGLLLAQLYDRPRPPSVFELSGVRPGHHDETSIGQIFGAVKNTRTSFRQRQNNILAPSTKEDSDDDDNSAVAFSTDATFELMVRLKEVLLFSISQRWQIFEAR
ncbi:hypothetical protein ID866_1470 [Astraeus odoratus]|nr:hypothetical protein ID866_1470 [Astraeus odoratus]